MTQQPIAPLIHLVGRNQDEPTDGAAAVVVGARRLSTALYRSTHYRYCVLRICHLLRCTGRSVRGQRSDIDRPETIDETAEMVIARGGVGIAVRVDRSKPAEVAAFFQRVAAKQKGQLDTLVNDVWGGAALVEFGKAFGEMDWKG